MIHAREPRYISILVVCSTNLVAVYAALRCAL